jgi:hypothetical protein
MIQSAFVWIFGEVLSLAILIGIFGFILITFCIKAETNKWWWK